MLPVDQLIPFIRHPDPLVSELAIHCLDEVSWPHPLNADFVLAAVEQGHRDLRKWLSHFTPTPAVLDYTVQFIRSADAGPDDLWPAGVIVSAPDELITPEIIAIVPQIKTPFEWVLERFRRRVEILSWPVEQMQERFLAACREAMEEGTAMSEQAEISALVTRLAAKPESYPWALEQLNQSLGKGDWDEIWLFRLLSKARQRPAFEAALARFPQVTLDDNECLFDELWATLSGLCQPADVPRLADLWDASDPEHRGGLISAVGKLRFEEAEPLLLRFAREAPETTEPLGPWYRTAAVAGLCEMVCTSDDAREFVRDIVDREAFDITYDDLERLAIPLGIIQGKPFAEEARWRERISEPALRNAERRALYRPHSPFEEEPPDLEYENALDLLAAYDDLAAYADADDDRLPPVTPPIIAQPKVGRNDPCPCGSGKKYKKCCLK